MKDLQKPLIHLNGSGAIALLDALNNAYHRCQDAMEAIRKTAPNGRDYYPLGDNAYKQAREEYDSRIERINSVAMELSELLIHVMDQAAK